MDLENVGATLKNEGVGLVGTAFPSDNDRSCGGTIQFVDQMLSVVEDRSLIDAAVIGDLMQI
jgi:hypothetical protein